jgi:hypothetical protein
MSSQTANGKAFEYAIIQQLQTQLTHHGFTVEQADSEPLTTAKNHFEAVSEQRQHNFLVGAGMGVEHVMTLEPHLQAPLGKLRIQLQSASTGVEGDPRDVIVSSQEGDWEMGISCKHNHSDLKHSRLSTTIDFGDQWMDIPVSEAYWLGVKPIFEQLLALKQSNITRWEEWQPQHTKTTRDQLKNQTFVIPVLQAFDAELQRLCKMPTVSSALITYIVGIKDYYQIMNYPTKKMAKVIAFNLHGKLGAPAAHNRERARVQKTKLPNSLISTVIRNTTLEVYFDQGWNLKFRLHTASSRIEPSLKFAVGLCSTPTSAYVHSQRW